MQVTDLEKQRKIRRKAADPLLVYDIETDLPMGQILDLSAKGMKLMTEEPVTAGQTYYLKIPLDKKIKGFKALLFDADCRWCKQSEDTGWYNSGYVLRFPNPKTGDAILELTRQWMIRESERINSKYQKSNKKKQGLFRRIFKA